MVRFIKDNFILVGISYKTAPVEIREKFSLAKENIADETKMIHAIDGIRECVVISTCNRTEIYAFINKPSEDVRKGIDRYILETSGMDETFLDHFFFHKGYKVIEHLFQVTCGLESMILGETQIFGQIKYSYALACDEGCTGPALNRLFHQAFQVGKLIRSTTAVSEGIVSVSSAAVLLAKKVFGSLGKRHVLLIGTGKIGKMCARQLIDSGIEELYITNRTTAHAEELAEELSGKVIPFENMADMFGTVDIIISSASSKKPLIHESLLLKDAEKRNGNHLALIDLGVPRNIESDVLNVKNTHLFNIDDLEEATMENRKRREKEAETAKELIALKVDEYCAWLEEREIIPIINNLREKCENIRLDELKKVNNRVNEETFEAIDLVTRRIVRKILHNPTITVRATGSGEARNRLVESINELFINEIAH